MNIIEINKQTLYNLYEQFPESFKGLSLEGKDLIYKNERIDISNFNINDLLTSETSFSSSLSVLAPEDIFKIIRLHVLKANEALVKGFMNEEEKIASVGEEKNQEPKEETRLLSSEQFAILINSPTNLSEQERKDVNLYYAHISDLIVYEDYLLPETKQDLNQFRSLVFETKYGNSEKPLNEKQQELILKNQEFEEKKALNDTEETRKQTNSDVKRLQLIKENENNTGTISTLQVIAFVVGVSIILTAITLYLIG